MGQHRFLGRLAEIARLPHHSPNYRVDDPVLQRYRLNNEADRNSEPWWRDEGRHRKGILGPIRWPFATPLPSEARIVVTVRDPRDALTSMFYSFAISHRGIAHDARARWREIGIDSFVMERLPDLAGRMAEYRRILQEHPDSSVLHYEDMVLRFDHWVDRLLKGFDLQLDPGAIAAFVGEQMDAYRKLIAERQVRERPGHHMRMVAPGGYRNKLRPETVAAIESTLAEELAFFGYPASSGR